MKEGKYDFGKYLNKPSARHHYIPQFLINGFTNPEGLLYLYDKEKDQILKNPRPPKSIFFELNRNTLELNPTTNSSIIEDLFYFDVDKKTSTVIKKYQTEELHKIDFQIEDSAILLFFLVTLFWRIPKTDYAAHNLLNASEIIANGVDSKTIRDDPAFRKLNKVSLFKHHFDEMAKFGTKGPKSVNIHQNRTPVYVIGDYPIVFKEQSGKFSEFNDTDILFAVSSDRIYSSTKDKINSLPLKTFMMYNACVINQSVRYIASGALNVLEQSVLFYKKAKEQGFLHLIEQEVFRME